jgi:hypothetical protein
MISRLMPWILRYAQNDKPVCIHSLVFGLHCLKSQRQRQERVAVPLVPNFGEETLHDSRGSNLPGGGPRL